MSLVAWRTFLAACRLASLSAAAQELGYTQSAVSRQIATLERLAGVPLLERHARGVVPTPAGEAFEHHARMVVTEADRAIRSAREATADHLRVTIGATPSTASGIVPTALRAVQDRRPHLRWTLVTGLTVDLEDRVVAGELDVAVVTDAPPGLPADPRLRRAPVGVDDMCVIVPAAHPLAGVSSAVSLETLADETWVEDNEGSAQLLRTAAARAGFEPRLDFAAADLTGKTALVAAGHAVALVPGLLLGALRPDVHAIRLTDPPRRGVFASLPAHADPAPTVVDLLDALLASTPGSPR